VVIRIEDNHDGKFEFRTVNGAYTFASSGTKRIRASYNGMEAEYSIRVLDPNGVLPPGSGTGGAIDPGGGNFIVW